VTLTTKVNSIHSANRQFCTNLQASTEGVHMSFLVS